MSFTTNKRHKGTIGLTSARENEKKLTTILIGFDQLDRTFASFKPTLVIFMIFLLKVSYIKLNIHGIEPEV